MFFVFFNATIKWIIKDDGDFSINEIYTKKKKYLSNNKDKFNTIYFGSSRLYRQLDPLLIDSLLTDYDIRSFNLASPATFNPEIYFLYEDFIKNNEVSFKYVFIELQDLQEISRRNILSKRNYYCADWNYLVFSYKMIFNSIRPASKKVYYYFTYGISFILNQIIPHNYSEINNEIKDDPIKPRGFYSLSSELIENKERVDIRHRKNQFLNDTSVLESRIRSAKEAFAKNKDEIIINQTHVDKLKSLIKLSEERGIELYFIIPPKQEHYIDIADLKYAFPKNKVFDMANYEVYSELYEFDYSFDVAHLNGKGSRLMSIYFAEEFKRILN